MSKILVLGDTHGDHQAVEYALNQAKKRGCETVVQVGDFGFGWEHTQPAVQVPFQKRVSKLAVKYGIDFLWLCGNHENHDQLEREVDTEAVTPQQMDEHLWYLPRGCTWNWDGFRCMALGGGYSIDKHARTAGYSWWPQEMITMAQVEKAMDAGKVDILFTHDAPEGTCPIVSPDYKGDHMSAANRRCIDAVVEICQPWLLIHGHYHYFYTDKKADMQVIGLGRDGDRERSWVILDSDLLERPKELTDEQS